MTDATQARALAEMMRVLKPGGRCFVAEMVRDGQSETQMTDVLIHHYLSISIWPIPTDDKTLYVTWAPRP